MQLAVDAFLTRITAIVLCNMYYTEHTIAEAKLILPREPDSIFPDLQRSEAFETSLQAVNKWFDAHLSIPGQHYIGMTFQHWW